MANKLLELIPIFLAISGLVTAALVILAAQGFARFVSTRLAARRERKEAQQVRTVAPSPLQGGGGLFARLSPFATRFKPQSEQALVGLRLKLAQAGLSAPGSVEKYAVVQLLSFAAAGAMIIPWILAGDAGVLLIGIAACGTVGMLLPRFWLAMRTGNRRERISSSLASTLDLLVTCMDAGLGLEQAVDRVALELRL
ncbi:MAG: hypothetical protein FJ125_04145, partial [Deltaproteobacteria bacterium]|nr:hypothetical protein [Deltaproteobacteria bacterium]